MSKKKKKKKKIVKIHEDYTYAEKIVQLTA